jgi:hypothetical protein
MVADRYAGASTWTKRIVREHYDQPVPKVGRDGAGIDSVASAGAEDEPNEPNGSNGSSGSAARRAARAKATSPS